MISRSFERPDRTASRTSDANNRYKIRYTRTQHRPASRQVNDHGRVSGTHRLACCVLAHNLARWTARLGRAHPTRQLTVAAPSATGFSPCRAASSTTAAATDCACRSTGHGQTPSPPPCDTSATCPNSSEPPTAPRAAQPNPTRHQPHQPHTPVLHAPKRAGPHTRTSPAATRPQTVDPTNPSVDSGLEPYVTVSRHTAAVCGAALSGVLGDVDGLYPSGDLMAHVALGECGDDAALTRRLHTSLGNQTPDDYEHHYCHTAGTKPALTT